jgi:hypothetical protein
MIPTARENEIAFAKPECLISSKSGIRAIQARKCISNLGKISIRKVAERPIKKI